MEAYLGTRKINRTIELAQEAQSFAAIARATTFDPNGNVHGTGIAVSSGERMPVKRISDRP